MERVLRTFLRTLAPMKQFSYTAECFIFLPQAWEIRLKHGYHYCRNHLCIEKSNEQYASVCDVIQLSCSPHSTNSPSQHFPNSSYWTVKRHLGFSSSGWSEKRPGARKLILLFSSLRRWRKMSLLGEGGRLIKKIFKVFNFATRKSVYTGLRRGWSLAKQTVMDSYATSSKQAEGCGELHHCFPVLCLMSRERWACFPLRENDHSLQYFQTLVTCCSYPGDHHFLTLLWNGNEAVLSH